MGQPPFDRADSFDAPRQGAALERRLPDEVQIRPRRGVRLRRGPYQGAGLDVVQRRQGTGPYRQRQGQTGVRGNVVSWEHTCTHFLRYSFTKVLVNKRGKRPLPHLIFRLRLI